MNQKKSLLAVSLVFALVFSSFASPIGGQAKVGRNESPKKYVKNKNAMPFLTDKEKQKYKGVCRIFKIPRKKKVVVVHTSKPWKFIKYGIKKIKTKGKKIKFKRSLLKKQKVSLPKLVAWRSVPSAIIACRIANAENQKLYKYNVEAKKINKKRYKAAKKRWKKRHKRGKIRYKKMKIKRYLDAKNICKNATVNSFDIDYTLAENADMPVHDSAQVKLSWKAVKNDTSYHVVKVEEEFKTEKTITEETTVNAASYEDSKIYTPKSILDNAPDVFFIYTQNKNKLNVYKKDFNYGYTLKDEIVGKLAKCNREEFKKTGICEGFNYFTLLELNKLRNSVGLDSLEYSAEMNEYAQIRAKECEAEFAGEREPHTRPDGSACDTVFPKEKVTDDVMKEPNKWEIHNEGITMNRGAVGLWGSKPHRAQLSLKESTHAAIGNYYNFCSITPIATGEKAVEIRKQIIKEENEKIHKFFEGCNIQLADYTSDEYEYMKNYVFIDFHDNFYPNYEQGKNLLTQIWYKGMPMKEYKDMRTECYNRSIQAGYETFNDDICLQVYKEYIEKHKKYKE